MFDTYTNEDGMIICNKEGITYRLDALDELLKGIGYDNAIDEIKSKKFDNADEFAKEIEKTGGSIERSEDGTITKYNISYERAKASTIKGNYNIDELEAIKENILLALTMFDSEPFVKEFDAIKSFIDNDTEWCNKVNELIQRCKDIKTTGKKGTI